MPLRLLVFLLPFLLLGRCSCSGNPVTTLTGPGSEYTLYLKTGGSFQLVTTPSPGAAITNVAGGTYVRLNGGFIQYTQNQQTYYGLEIPGFGAFTQINASSTLVIPMLEQLSCAPDSTWNWVGLRTNGATDDTTAPFFGAISQVGSNFLYTHRYNLATFADQGSQTIPLAQTCSNGEAVGDSTTGGNGWYFQSSAGLLGETSSASNFVLGLPQTIINASDISGAMSGVAIRRVGSTETVNWVQFTATPAGANCGIIGNPVNLPASTTDTTHSFNINLTSFNVIANGIATGTITVGDPALSGSLSISLDIACAGVTTAGSLQRPVLYCVSEGYVGDGSSKAGAQSFHFILRGV